MKLFWSTRSPFVRFVMIVAHEKAIVDSLELEQVIVALTKPNEQVMAHNPLNKLPTLILDDGSALYDSRVIADYFDSLGNGPSLWPSDPAVKLTAARQVALGVGLLDLLVAWLPDHRKPAAGQDGELTAALTAKFDATLDVLEREAANLADRTFDMGHAAVGAALGYADFRYDDLKWRDGRDGLASAYEALCQRPSFAATAHRDVY